MLLPFTQKRSTLQIRQERGDTELIEIDELADNAKFTQTPRVLNKPKGNNTSK